MEKSNFEVIKNNTKEVIWDLLEGIIDNQLEINFKNIDKIFLEIPILKTIFSVKNTIIGIKERMFLKRFIKFVIEASSYSEKEKEKFFKKISDDKNLENRLIEIIDKLDEDEKVLLMSNILKNYVNEKITRNQFFRYMKILLNLTFLDIEYLKSKTNYTGKEEETYILVANNLIQQQHFTYAELGGTGITKDILEKRKFFRTTLGENFLKAIENEE